MKNQILDLTFELAPMSRNSWVGLYSTVVCHLQLLIDGHGSENDLLAAGGVFGWIAIECRLQVYKPVVELSDITVISQLCAQYLTG